jgi:valyl-tRNA synthetase
MNGCALVAGFTPTQCRLTVNRWIVSAVSNCAAAVTTALDAYRFDEAASRLYQFVWGTFCDWYVEFTKPILQGDEEAARTETQATTAWVLGRIVHLLHPIMPFITEEVWQNLAGEEAGLLLTSPWPETSSETDDPAASAEMEWVVEAISALRALRAEMGVPPAARIPLLLKDVEPLAAERIRRHREHFMRLSRVEGLEPVLSVPAGGIQAIVDGATLILRLGDVVDLSREKARLGKEIGRLDAELAKIAAKLANPDFLAKAKSEIVEEQREREADVSRDRDRIKTAYNRLTAI